jgi:membrane protease YdiL (CAAX protease family)
MELHSKRHPVPSDVVAGVLVYLGALFLLGLLVPGGFPASSAESPANFFVAEIVDALLLVCIPLFFIFRIYSEPVGYFGFSAPAPGRDLVAGLGVGVGLAIVGFAYSEAIKWFGYSYEHPYLELFSDSTSPAMSAAVILAVVALLPVAEEIFFRGFIFSVIRSHTSTSIAVAISATLFGLAHLSASSFAFNVVFGAVLALLLHRTTSLLSPIAAHVTFNAIALAVRAVAEPRMELLGS